MHWLSRVRIFSISFAITPAELQVGGYESQARAMLGWIAKYSASISDIEGVALCMHYYGCT
jgi:hypothetical protein